MTKLEQYASRVTADLYASKMTFDEACRAIDEAPRADTAEGAVVLALLQRLRNEASVVAASSRLTAKFDCLSLWAGVMNSSMATPASEPVDAPGIGNALAAIILKGVVDGSLVPERAPGGAVRIRTAKRAGDALSRLEQETAKQAELLRSVVENTSVNEAEEGDDDEDKLSVEPDYLLAKLIGAVERYGFSAEKEAFQRRLYDAFMREFGGATIGVDVQAADILEFIEKLGVFVHVSDDGEKDWFLAKVPPMVSVQINMSGQS